MFAKQKSPQGCLKLFSTFALAHRKWQIVPEDRGSLGKRPHSGLGPKRRLVEKESVERAWRAHGFVYCYEVTYMERSMTVDALEGQHQDLELCAPFDWQPVKLRERGFVSIIIISRLLECGR